MVSTLSFSSLAQHEGISVSGKVTRVVEPDEMTVRFTVSSQEVEIQDAFEATEDKTTKIIAYLESLEESCEVATQHISLYEKYEWNPESEERVRVGFTAMQTLRVTLTDFGLYPSVMTRLLELGASSIGGVSFACSKEQEIRNSLRKEAIEVAKEKAAEVAEALNVELGAALEFEEVDQDRYSFRDDMRYSSNSIAFDMPAESEGSISPGKQTIHMEVQVRFAILAPEE